MRVYDLFESEWANDTLSKREQLNHLNQRYKVLKNEWDIVNDRLGAMFRNQPDIDHNNGMVNDRNKTWTPVTVKRGPETIDPHISLKYFVNPNNVGLTKKFQALAKRNNQIVDAWFNVYDDLKNLKRRIRR